MAVTIGLGSSAGVAGKGHLGFSKGLEAVFAQLDGISADGSSPEGDDPSALAENPFVAQLAAALGALQPGSQHDLQAAALVLAQQGLKNGPGAEGARLPFGQELPLDPSFPSAVLATFAAINEIIRQQALLAEQGPESQSDLLAQAELDAQALALAQLQAKTQAETESSQQLLMTDPSQAAALVAAVPGQVSVAANTNQPVDFSADTNSLKPVDLSADTNSLAAGVAGASAQTANSNANFAVDSPGPENLQPFTTAVQAAPVAQEQLSQDAGIQAVVNRLQAELSQSPETKDSNLKALSTVAAQNNASGANTDTLLANAVAEVSADTAFADAGFDAEALARGLELTANSAASARQAADAPVMQQSELNLAVDAARASAAKVDNIASQSQVSGASMESRIEAARASLASGPLNVEVLRLTRQGGGRAVLEVTPPNQGPIRLDLQLDGSGRANLVVEGLSEALRARLEGTAHFLRQDMAQMGLALNLEMRERSDAQAQQAAFGQGGSQSQRETEREFRENSLTSTKGLDSSARAIAARGGNREDGVHLYA